MRRFLVTVAEERDGAEENLIAAEFSVSAEHVSVLFEPSIAARLREPEHHTHRVYFTRVPGGTYEVTASDNREAWRIAARQAAEDGHQNLLLAHYEIEEL